MKSLKAPRFLAAIFPAMLMFSPLLPAQSLPGGPPPIATSTPAKSRPFLGEAAKAPADFSGLPQPGPERQDYTVTGGFNVNADSREQVRAFYNGIYPSSDNVPMDSTADVSTCAPGTNSTAFVQAVLRRINWFRAMAGDPATVTFDPAYNADCQLVAVMISSSGLLNHTPPPTWPCYTIQGASAAIGNQAGGFNGADAITGYIWDFGGNNSEVGHRRWILYPTEQVMGTGDLPQSGTNIAGNCTYVMDPSSFNTPRPATRQPCVSWPPEGFVPYQLTYPYWSFALSNADSSAATVAMTSNGAPVSVVIQPYLTGYGENTLVWVPMGLDGTLQSTLFPFNGADTVYSVTVSNITLNGGAKTKVSYNVTVFDPAVPGGDYVPPTISGPAQPFVNGVNAYACVPVNNPNATSYQWRVTQCISGNLSDNANNGLVNFSISPAPPNYPIITNAQDGSGNCFHLCHSDTNSYPQLLQLKEMLFPAASTTVSFKSSLGYATSDETARVQVSVDGGMTWQDIYTQAGTGGAGETTFTPHTLALSGFAGRPTLLRFDYDFQDGNYYPQDYPSVGWCLENIVVTNCEQLVNAVTNSMPSTNFTFTPAQTGNFNLEARALIFTEFPLDWGPVKEVTAISNNAPVISMKQPVLSGGQVRLDFALTSGVAGTFKLLQADTLGGTWSTNASATLTTNVPGSSFRFTTAVGLAARFYRILDIPGP